MSDEYLFAGANAIPDERRAARRTLFTRPACAEFMIAA